MIVKAVDLSLTSTGIAMLEVGPFSGWTGIVERITSEGRADATLPERVDRITKLASTVWVQCSNADLVLIEGPSYGSKGGHKHDRSGLWWLVLDSLWRSKIPVVEVAPNTLKRYATGKGIAGKDQVLAAVVRRYPTVEVTGNDEADALVLAAMGARHLGEPIDDPLPKTHLAAMDAVAWPLE